MYTSKNQFSFTASYQPSSDESKWRYGGTFNDLEVRMPIGKLKITQPLHDQSNLAHVLQPASANYPQSKNIYSSLQKVIGDAKPLYIQRPRNFFENATALRLKLLRGNHTRLCPLQSLEVWCTFSSKASTSVKQEFTERYRNLQALTEPLPQQIPSSAFGRSLCTSSDPFLFEEEITELPPLTEIEKVIEAKQIQVPQRFIDPLVHSLMLHPVITPSRTRIDRQTRE